VIEMTRSTSELIFVPYEEVYGLGIQDMLHRMPAVDKIRAAIGWEPTLELDLILADVIKHIRTAPVPLPERDTMSAP
jgi:UDP-glucose 4-epimerase